MKKLKLFIFTLFMTTMATLLSGCIVKVAVPKVKKASFDFSVTYEIDGEEKTYVGVYVCEYDGVLTTFLGNSLEWKGYLEKEEEIDLPIQTNEDGVVYINFGFSPKYFMGDPSAADYESPVPNLSMMYNDSEPDVLNITSDEDVIAGYGVRLIGFEYAAPIENAFEEEVCFSRFVPSIN